MTQPDRLAALLDENERLREAGRVVFQYSLVRPADGYENAVANAAHVLYPTSVPTPVLTAKTPAESSASTEGSAVQPDSHQQIRAELAAATPGPWRAQYDAHNEEWVLYFQYAYLEFDPSDFDDFDRKRWPGTITLIANAPAHLAALLDENERLRAVVEAARRSKEWIESPVTAGGKWQYQPGWAVISDLRDALAHLDATSGGEE